MLHVSCAPHLAFALALLGCASTPDHADPGPGPMRPLEPDHALDEAPPIDVDDQPAMEAWLATRVAAARAGTRERVRLPIVRRSAAFGCDCPPFAIAARTANGPFYWIRIVDLTSIGLPPAATIPSDEGALLWVDGRFTGLVDTYRSRDAGGRDVATPVFEVLRVRPRAADEAAEARVVAAEPR